MSSTGTRTCGEYHNLTRISNKMLPWDKKSQTKPAVQNNLRLKQIRQNYMYVYVKSTISNDKNVILVLNKSNSN